MTLGTVTKKLSEGAESLGGHVPYWDSKLIWILQLALGGNANTAIICNITLAQMRKITVFNLQVEQIKTVYKLTPDEGKNLFHGGAQGFSNVAWKVTRYTPQGQAPHIVFTYFIKDGDQGFPSDLRVTVSYTLLPDNQLSVAMKAKNLGKKATPVSLTQHTYWNLGGHNSGDILSEWLWLFGAFHTPVDEQNVPTGQKTYAVGTPYDFQTEPKFVKGRMDMIPGNPYDTNYVLDGEFNGQVKRAAVLHDRNNGIKLEIFTNAPVMQLYTGGKLKNVNGKGGAVYKANAGVCLEPQWYPDFVDHPEWPQSIVMPGKRYLQNTVYKFSTGLKA